MKEIASVQGRLEWIQPRALKMDYELRNEEDLVATLRFRSMAGSFATGESADGCWTFKRVGFFQTRATVRECGSDAEVATFANNTWSDGGALTLAGGQVFLVNTNVWQTRLEFQTESGEVLLQLHTGSVLQDSAAVSISPLGRQSPALPWMVMFGWYLIVMMQTDGSSFPGVISS